MGLKTGADAEGSSCDRHVFETKYLLENNDSEWGRLFDAFSGIVLLIHRISPSDAMTFLRCYGPSSVWLESDMFTKMKHSVSLAFVHRQICYRFMTSLSEHLLAIGDVSLLKVMSRLYLDPSGRYIRCVAGQHARLLLLGAI